MNFLMSDVSDETEKQIIQIFLSLYYFLSKVTYIPRIKLLPNSTVSSIS